MYPQTDIKYTLEDAKKDSEKIYNIVNNMTKIQLKCWIAYCEYAYREENREKAIDFDVYCNVVLPSTYIGHIKSGEINCDDIGGKEAAILIVEKWFGITN
jgi:hypothetical protein